MNVRGLRKALTHKEVRELGDAVQFASYRQISEPIHRMV